MCHYLDGTSHLFLGALYHKVLAALGVCLDSDQAPTVMPHGKLPYLGAVVLADAFLLRVEAHTCHSVAHMVQCSTTATLLRKYGAWLR